MSAPAWWSSLRHGGMLVAPARLAALIDADVPALAPAATAALRRAMLRRGGSTDGELLSVVLEQTCGLTGTWQRGALVDERWRHRLVTGEVCAPRAVWHGAHDSTLPVFVTDDATLGVGSGRRSFSRVLEWMRAVPAPIALVTNLRQWRLCYAGIDHDAWCESDSELWFEDAAEGQPLTALRYLLAPATLAPAAAGEPAPLLAAILASRRGQAELSAELGERVRRAVERLIQAHGPALAALRAGTAPVDAQAIYRAGVRLVMRLVVACFAEARDLLPRANAIYHASYGLQALREHLDRHSGDAERLSRQHGAWPRLIALFRLIHDGSHHPDLNLTRYGGELFAPGDPGSGDPLARSLAVFESPEPEPGGPISDAVVAEILRLITFVPVAIRQGRAANRVLMPVDFADLSSEYLGIIYEGLLDYELKRVDGDDPVVFLAVGNQPALPLSRLESLSGGDLKDLLAAFKKAAKAPAPDSDEGDADADDDVGDAIDEATGQDDAATASADTDPTFTADDARRAAAQRFQTWARGAVTAAGLVGAGRGRRGSTDTAAVDAAAAALAARIVLPGEWYLVRWGGTRKGHGTFYTRPGLAAPLVHRTLAPLIADPPAEGDQAPLITWQLKDPAHLLAQTVCDPACGSGSMLVAALRFLADGLWRSLVQHGWVRPEPDGLRLQPPADCPAWLAESLLVCRPQDPGAEDRLKALLKRLVVERCIYGVELDPLATELARLALWIETMDRDLPFGFLDHKVRNGNSLVGAWFDQVGAYPIMAWERKSGDESFRGARHAADTWANAIAERRNEARRVLVDQIAGVQSFLRPSGRDPAEIHRSAVTVLERIHAIPPHRAEERAALWRNLVRNDPDLARLRLAFDAWCALWFWPADRIADAPLSDTFVDPAPAARTVIAEVAQRLRFFHWELEFPEVFHRTGGGFSAMVGNPPWETLQPNSKEFFSEYDPLYRTYSKQAALRQQQALFAQQPVIEDQWLAYLTHFKGMGHWFQAAADPFGVGINGGDAVRLVRGRTNADVHARWMAMRRHFQGFADPGHAFRYQGQGKAYTYKMFLEQAHALLRIDGQLGFLVPSNVYTDKGSADLRRQFLEHCRWRMLYSFENRNKLFDIHGSFKFAALIITKGGQTDALQTAFMRRSLDDWQAPIPTTLACPSAQIERFSPLNRVVLEVTNERDLGILGRMYSNGVLLGDASERGWGVTYRQGDFNMTSDSKLFPPREQWEADGYRADEYGHWLKGDWQPYAGDRSILHRPDGLVLSVDGAWAIAVDAIADVALPLYEGRMIDQFDLSSKGWVSGKGRQSVWRDIQNDSKRIEPQFLIAAKICTEQPINPKTGEREQPLMSRGLKLSFMDIGSATNQRTMFAASLYDRPCGNSAPVLAGARSSLAAVLNAYAYDFAVRQRCGGLHLNYFVIEETPLVSPSHPVMTRLAVIANALTAIHEQTASAWLATNHPWAWRRCWAVTPHERLRLRCIADALVAHAYGLTPPDFAWILRDCDHPTAHTQSNDFTRALDPKGFWRVDKAQDPELRHTVLAQVAYQDLHRLGVDAFLTLNEGDGWELPAILRLADYGLGHDDRAKHPQLVADRLGERFLPWQLAQSVDESWEECRRHAAMIALIVPPPEAEPARTAPVHGPGPSGSVPGTPVIRPASGSVPAASATPRATEPQMPMPTARPASTGATADDPRFARLLHALRERGSLASTDAQTLLDADAATVRPLLQRLESDGYATTTGQRRGLRYVAVQPDTPVRMAPEPASSPIPTSAPEPTPRQATLWDLTP